MHERYRRQTTDRQQTDGRATANTRDIQPQWLQYFARLSGQSNYIILWTYSTAPTCVVQQQLLYDVAVCHVAKQLGFATFAKCSFRLLPIVLRSYLLSWQHNSSELEVHVIYEGDKRVIHKSYICSPENKKHNTVIITRRNSTYCSKCTHCVVNANFNLC